MIAACRIECSAPLLEQAHGKRRLPQGARQRRTGNTGANDQHVYRQALYARVIHWCSLPNPVCSIARYNNKSAAVCNERSSTEVGGFLAG